MSSPIVFDGSIPQIYDAHLGPLLFEPYAADLTARLPLQPHGRVLEIACGTGIVTRRLRDRLPAGARLVATDLNAPMLAFARARLSRHQRVDWGQADASALPFAADVFDGVLCQFGLMFVADKAAAMREARRVLKAGRTFAFNVWERLEHNPIGQIAHETITRFFPTDPPTFYRVPFGFFDRDLIVSMLAESGFGDIRTEPVTLPGVSVSARHAAIGLVRGNPAINEIRERGSADEETIIGAVEEKLAAAGGDKPMQVELRALVVTARKPS